MAIEIRPANRADAGPLAPLFAQLGYPTDPAEIASRLEALAPDAAMLLAKEGGVAVAGFVAVAVHSDLITGRRAHILGLVVAEGSRGKGIGAVLLDAAERWALQRGVATIVVRSNVIRGRAHRFYKRLGYGRVKTQHVFEKRKPPQ